MKLLELFDSKNIYDYHVFNIEYYGDSNEIRYEFVTKDQVTYKVLMTIWNKQRQGRIDFHTTSRNIEHQSAIELINTHDAIKVFNTIKAIIYDNRKDIDKLIISSTDDRIQFYKKMLDNQHIKYVQKNINGQPFIIATL